MTFDYNHKETKKEEVKFNKIACLAGVLFLLAMYLAGWVVSEKLEIATIIETDMFIGIIFFIGLSTGNYVGKALTKKGNDLNSFLIGSFSTMFITVFISMIIQLIDWRHAIFMVFLTGSVLAMHVSNLIDKHENVDKLVKMFAEYLPGFVLPAVSVFYYLIPFILSLIYGT